MLSKRTGPTSGICLGMTVLDDPALADVMNQWYANEWRLLQKHFCPTMKLQEKKRIGARYQRKYAKPETPTPES